MSEAAGLERAARLFEEKAEAIEAEAISLTATQRTFVQMFRGFAAEIRALGVAAPAEFSHAEFKAVWERMTEVERERVRDKATWEQRGIWAVMKQWPGLIPERLRRL
jgi:hypothetical protein